MHFNYVNFMQLSMIMSQTINLKKSGLSKFSTNDLCSGLDFRGGGGGAK